MTFYLYSVGVFLLGWFCCCLVTFGRREDELARLLMEKDARENALHVFRRQMADVVEVDAIAGQRALGGHTRLPKHRGAIST